MEIPGGEVLWYRVREGLHTAVLGVEQATSSPLRFPHSDVTVVQVGCRAIPHPMGLLAEIRQRVERLVDGATPLIDLATEKVKAGLLKRFFGEEVPTEGAPGLVEELNRLQRQFHRPLAVVLDDVEHADAETLEILRQLVARPDWCKVPFVLLFRSPNPSGASLRLVETLRLMQGSDAVIRLTEESEVPQKAGGEATETADAAHKSGDAAGNSSHPTDAPTPAPAGPRGEVYRGPGTRTSMTSLASLSEMPEGAGDSAVPTEIPSREGAANGTAAAGVGALPGSTHLAGSAMGADPTTSASPENSFENNPGNNSETDAGLRAASSATANEGSSASSLVPHMKETSMSSQAQMSESKSVAHILGGSVPAGAVETGALLPMKALVRQLPEIPRRVLRVGSLYGLRFPVVRVARVLELNIQEALEALQDVADLGIPLHDDGDGWMELPESAWIQVVQDILPSLARTWRARLATLESHAAVEARSQLAEQQAGERLAEARREAEARAEEEAREALAREEEARREAEAREAEEAREALAREAEILREAQARAAEAAREAAREAAAHAAEAAREAAREAEARAAEERRRATEREAEEARLSAERAAGERRRAEAEAAEEARRATARAAEERQKAAEMTAEARRQEVARAAEEARKAVEASRAQASARASRARPSTRTEAQALEDTGREDELVNRLLVSAEQLSGSGAHAEAIRELSQALNVLKRLPMTEPRRMALIRAYANLGRNHWSAATRGLNFNLLDALQLMTRAVELLKAGDPPVMVADVRAQLAGVCYDLGDPAALDQALEQLTQASRELMEAGDAEGAARFLNDQAAVWLRLGDPVRAHHLLMESKKVFEPRAAQDRVAMEELAETNHLLARLTFHVPARPGRENDALQVGVQHAQAAEATYRQLNNLRELARVWETHGRLLAKAGQPQQAAEVLERAFQTQQQLGDIIGLGRTAGALAELMCAAGDLRRGLVLLRESLALNVERKSPQGVTYNRQSFENILRQLSAQQRQVYKNQLNAVALELAQATARMERLRPSVRA